MKTSTIALASVVLFATNAAAVDAPGRMPQFPAGPPVIAAKAPNLVPIASRMTKGTVSVRNTGTASAGPFKVTVECNAMGKRGGCADPPKGAVAPYEDAAFPDKLTVLVPNLAPGNVFNHKIAFWDALVWSSGNYEFTVVADAGTVVAETNEGDNSGGTVMNVP